jgi:RNA ligase (TIGR02306 family)
MPINQKTGLRELASIKKIDAIKPIEGADLIEVAQIDGWEVVVKKGEFIKGDECMYFEIDSVLPDDEPLYEFLRPRGFRVKTIKLRGQISQGLVFPLSNILLLTPFPSLAWLRIRFPKIGKYIVDTYSALFSIDWDSILRVTKHGLRSRKNFGSMTTKADLRGLFPDFIRKTDQERVQNLNREFSDKKFVDHIFEVTEKLEGMSTTYYLSPFEKEGYSKNMEGAAAFSKDDIAKLPEYYGFCSRNFDLKKGFESMQETTGRKLGLEEILRNIHHDTGLFLALQGELVGPSIQANYYNLEEIKWYCFDIMDCKTRKYLNPKQRRELCEKYNIPQVPLLEFQTFEESTMNNSAFFVKNADGKSLLNPSKNREGLVFKSLNDPDVCTFKAISNNYLLKTADVASLGEEEEGEDE